MKAKDLPRKEYTQVLEDAEKCYNEVKKCVNWNKCDVTDEGVSLIIGFAEDYYKHASTPTRQVSDEEIEKAFPIKEPEENEPLTVYYTKLNNRHKCYRMGAKWMRDQDPITTSLPSEDKIMKELLDRWGFAEDGAVDCGEQLKIFSFMNWIKSLSSTREGEDEWISVEDRLPEGALGNYLVCLKNEAVMEFNYSDMRTCQWFSLSSGDMHSSNPVTHWQPLPKPPTKTR